jgi:hypothetical protein
MAKEVETILVHPAVASLSPNNPAGLESLLRVVNGEVRYLDLNEGLLLDWMMSRDSLQQITDENKGNRSFNDNLRKLGINGDRLEEVIGKADEAREAFTKIETYSNFPRFVECKRILEDAAKIVSAPYITDKEVEEVIIHRNTFGYYNSQFLQSRESLLALTASAGLYKRFIQDQAIPRILKNNPEMVGISVTHPDQYVFAFQLAYQLRQSRPEIVTLFGGSAISRRVKTWAANDDINQKVFRPSRNEKTGIIDGLVISEGELALAQLSAKLVEDPHLDVSQLFDGVYGTIYNKGSSIVFNSLPPNVKPESLWHRKDVFKKLTRGLMPEGRKMQSLVDGRVCTYECATGGCEYCAISKGYLELTNQTVKRLKLPTIPIMTDLENSSLSNVEATPDAQTGKRGIRIINQRRLGAFLMANEIEEGLKEGFSVVDITDEQFTVDQAIELASALAKKGINNEHQDIVYACFMRIDDAGDKTDYMRKYGKSLADLLTDPVFVAKLSKGGLKFAQFGLETTYPPKMQAMVKGTSDSKVQKFGEILQNFSENGIMSHIFVIVGYPLKEQYLKDGKKFAFEESILGRKVDVDDLEILEAIYNLKFLHDHRNYIYTFKHAPFELSYGAPMADRPEEFGLVVDKELFSQTDLSNSIPFKYSPKVGPSKHVLDDLMDLYSVWKREELPYQPVVQEFQYSQRIIPELGAANIKAIAHELYPMEERVVGEADKVKKDEVLQRIWHKLAGADENTNLVQVLFPNGFKSYEDLYTLADRLESLRKTG